MKHPDLVIIISVVFKVLGLDFLLNVYHNTKKEKKAAFIDAVR